MPNLLHIIIFSNQLFSIALCISFCLSVMCISFCLSVNGEIIITQRLTKKNTKIHREKSG